MNKKNIFFTSFLMLVTMVFSAHITISAILGHSLLDFSKLIRKEKRAHEITLPLVTARCSDRSPIKNLNESSDSRLIQLEKYQKVCRSEVTRTIMIFTDMPKDKIIAHKKAEQMAKDLKLFSQYGISPLVIVEPVTAWGLIDFKEFRSGFYDSFIEAYFQFLKKEGVTDSQMGTWVPFPEANLPLWNHVNATPYDYSAIVNRYLRILKKYFPQARGSILLNSATYENDDFNWVSGEYVSLRPYLVDLDKELIDSFGVQGFPWAPPKTARDKTAVLNAQEFLTESIIDEAAQILGVKKIWINTGTFGAKYTLDPEKTIYITPDVRLDILNEILSQAVKLKHKGYEVTVNLFVQDKSRKEEATDWSYLRESFSGSEETEIIFREFVAKANREGINISLFDRAEDKEN